MNEYRITQHPILSIPQSQKKITFYWGNQEISGQRGDTISSALFANGIHIFGHHPKDHSPQGIFCANGQCSQCMVIADDVPVKSCMTNLHEGMHIHPLEGLPVLPKVNSPIQTHSPEPIKVSVLIIGGGPAGLSAAIELGKAGIDTLLIDDKHRLGGKLVLQTHRFFGSAKTVYAGMRGIDIAARLEDEVRKYSSIKIWLDSTALSVFSDQRVGIWKGNQEYVLIEPRFLLTSTGARERFLTFNGNTLPGVMGAGAFQTLLNRDLVKPGNRLFIIGGGNVGLIAGFHALQAGLAVQGLAEVLAECGGYKVHKDKLSRVGVPIYTSHTVLSANGVNAVESITIAEVDKHFQPILGTEKIIACDTVLIAVGLDPVNEFYKKARQFDMDVFAAGDAEEIAEASAAIFSGKIEGTIIGQKLGDIPGKPPQEWYDFAEILKSKPGNQIPREDSRIDQGVLPVIHCTQEIPCDPCSNACPKGLIFIDQGDIRHIPNYIGTESDCAGCAKCLTACPGQAITLVDFRKNPNMPIVSIPYELQDGKVRVNDTVTVVDTVGNDLGRLEVMKISSLRNQDRTSIVKVTAPRDLALRIAGIRIQERQTIHPNDQIITHSDDDMIICRCERVTAAEIRRYIRMGYRDLNEIKTITRAGMGACGSKTCNNLIYRLFNEEGIPTKDIIESTRRPIFVEVPLGDFAGVRLSKEVDHD